MSLGLQKHDKQEALDLSNYLNIFQKKADEITKSFEDDKKAKDNRLKKFEGSIIIFANFSIKFKSSR